MSASNPPSGPVLPVCDEDALPFYVFARERKLCVQRCPDSGRWIFPPRPVSPYGAHRAPVWETVSGRGTIWSFVVPHPPMLPYFAERAPFNVVLVALDEDPTVRLAGNVVEGDDGALRPVPTERLRIGAPVRVVFDRLDDEWTLPRWVLA
mgnify:CR=1 FL=1